MAIYYFPHFNSASDFNDQASRAVWYFGSLSGEAINFYSDIDVRYEVKPHFSPDIQALFDCMYGSGQLKVKQADKLNSILLGADDYVILWKAEEKLDESELAWLAKCKKSGARLYDVNKSRRMEGSIYIEVSRNYFNADIEFLPENQLKFDRLLSKYSDKNSAFLFCTGPSISEYTNYCYDSGLKIVCNSVINDEEFMATVRPDILVFADPIFHFGCSSYTHVFREKLRDSAARYNFDIAIPIKYYPLFCYAMPDLADRVVGLPYAESDEFNLDLGKEFSLKTTDNILTFLMLPLGTTLADTVYVMGCDGRPLDEDDYFWSHNKKAQFTGEMKSIQKAHPSFFKLEYNEYYLRHCDNVERFFQQGEKVGKKFVSLGFTHILALKSREFKYRSLATNTAGALFVSINPDLKDKFGHYYHYDERVAETLHDDEDLLILANKNSEVADEICRVEPLFSRNTWVLRWNQNPELIHEWCKELATALDGLFVLKRTKHVYMYMGAIRFYEGVLALLTRHKAAKDIDFKINLFYSHMDFASDGFLASNKFEESKRMLEYYSHSNLFPVKLYSDSERLKRNIVDNFGCDLDLWPMIGVTSPDLIESFKNQMSEDELGSEEIVVLFPGNGQIAKGFDFACDFIRSYESRPVYKGKQIRFLIRDQLRDTEISNNLLEKKLKSIRDFSWVDVIGGHLTEEEYLALYKRADIVILPYRQSAFYSRTSGCLIDALNFEKPILSFNNTWLGDWVQRLQVGKTVDEGDIVELKKALIESLSDAFTYPLDLQKKFGAQNLTDLLRSDISNDINYTHSIMSASLRRLFNQFQSLFNLDKPLTGSLSIKSEHENSVLSENRNVGSIARNYGRIERIAYRLEAYPFIYKCSRHAWQLMKRFR
ncbi:hypothetical protein [Marinibactrum halimedae]|uniref:Glycosyltransferase n=1 Tax=Marinibactrum halimedae TaxID=1444977 RepID=A0AA37T4H9_9GAMM|nr:hypothetical protein [Marinibactrum halimedae]MCD9459843.1 hypothetical protein [Marinibactrum halimedae]GLS26963.1 hypothetical protein GCM10007877_26820 [Marinibactrum halimedae]